MPISLEQVNYIYGAGLPYEKHALKNISLTIEDGEFVGIIGHTGSGKSTLIQLLDGLLSPTSGKILFQGQDISAKGFSKKALCGKVGIVFQYPEYQLFETTVLKDVMFGPKNLGNTEADALSMAQAALRKVGLPEKSWELSPFELSGGEKRRAAIAGVIAMRPEVLILDEPTAGLDPAGRDALFSMICRLHEQEGVTVILVSHSMEDIAEYVGRAIVLEDGSVLCEGTPKEIFSQKDTIEGSGLAIPQVAALMQELRNLGLPVDRAAITIQQAKEEILKLC